MGGDVLLGPSSRARDAEAKTQLPSPYLKSPLQPSRPTYLTVIFCDIDQVLDIESRLVLELDLTIPWAAIDMDSATASSLSSKHSFISTYPRRDTCTDIVSALSGGQRPRVY
jgi:hypothetical protein